PRAERGKVAAGARLAVPLAPAERAEQGVADEALLLRLGAVLEQRGHEHARPLAHDLVGRTGATELIGDDRRLERIGGLLRAAVAPRHVAVEVAALDRQQAERGGARVGPDVRAGQVGEAGGSLAPRLPPVLDEESAPLGAEAFVLSAVAEVHPLSSSPPDRF